MSTVKKLDLVFTIEDFTNNFYESISESKYLNQITHLKIWNRKSQTGNRIDLLLKDKIHLECLVMQFYDLTICPNLLINGNYNNLQHVNISYCKIENQEFANLFISPNLPKLETIKAEYLNNEIDNTVVAVFPKNSQSSITELDLKGFKPELFPSLFDHCPKLKHLTIYTNRNEKTEAKKIFLHH